MQTITNTAWPPNSPCRSVSYLPAGVFQGVILSRLVLYNDCTCNMNPYNPAIRRGPDRQPYR